MQRIGRSVAPELEKPDEHDRPKIDRQNKVVRRVNKEGIKDADVVTSLRPRKPKFQVVDDRYGNVVY